MRIWALVPARGGSKSIPLKNLAQLGGRPLIDYVVLSAKAWGRCERLVCSTDAEAIARRMAELGVETDTRPARLAADDTPVADVARDFIVRGTTTTPAPDWLLLLQPTSPFVLPRHLDALEAAIRSSANASSAQTLVPVPHNHHAWNQRVLNNGQVRFAMAELRARAHNKQLKPRHYVFGNLVAAKVAALLAGGDFFSSPSLGIEIERPYDLDVDGRADLELAEAVISQGLVRLDHLSK
ncbi:MAG: cytidylyltransferase domain-containing protein [Woeseiaceae bacterium]